MPERDAGLRKRPRILYIHPGNSPPLPQRERNAAYHLSELLDGDLITVSWDDQATYDANRERYGELLGGFGYHPSLTANVSSGPIKAIRQVWHYFRTAVRLSRSHGPYDAIVVYGPYKTALAALLAKLFTGTPLIVQMITNPYRSLAIYSESPVARVKQALMGLWLPILLRFTDHIHCVYPNQVRAADYLPEISVFPDFAAVSPDAENRGDDGYLFFLGHPWHLKGVDVLIRAFQLISPEFPEIRLKIVGHCPDRTPFEQLADGNPRVEFEKAMPHAEAMDLMSRCTFFVLASRTDAMPRVLFEAWGAGKAVVASDVDGIPSIVRDGENGLLFRSEDHDDLAEKLRLLLRDAELRDQFGRAGQEMVRNRYLENHYARAFRDMVTATTKL